jgi:16S rRNA G966 N2-methylase RsmD
MKALDDVSKQFILANINAKVEDLLLKKSFNQLENSKEIAEQIKARQKIKQKLPTWYSNINLYLPPSISLEQSSSEQTAKFKAELVSGQLLIDLSGGMGIDFWAMSTRFSEAIYIEKNQALKEITEFNLKQLNINNTTFYAGDSFDFLTNFYNKADWIFIDPARRDTENKRLVLLENCEPNILNINTLLIEKSENILLKCSPMLDINLAIKQLKYVQSVYIICIDNEVKELLFHLKANENTAIEIKVINYQKEEKSEFSFIKNEENLLTEKVGPIQEYLYEPNAGIMKAGAFKTITNKFDCQKLHTHTHLYTSSKLIENFPGRCFQVENVLKASASELKKANIKKANLTIRNFPANVDVLKKKLGITDGGTDYLFACTNYLNEKIILQTTKIN